MTLRLKRALLTVVSGSALAIAPLAFATVVVPAASQAEPCPDVSASADGDQSCDVQPQAKGQGANCPDGTVVDGENNQCVDLLAGISKQLQALPPPPALSGFGGGGGGLGLPGGFPSLGTINAPDLVLPSVGLGLVPNLNVNLQPQLPAIGSFNPANPLGLPAL